MARSRHDHAAGRRADAAGRPARGRAAPAQIPDADTARAADLAAAALSGGRRLGRTALLGTLADGGVATGGQRGAHLLLQLAAVGLLCLGPTGGAGQQQFVLAEEWLPPAPARTREEALAELALRYVRGHGPATVADLVRWTGLRVPDVRAGVAAVRDRLASVEVDGTELLLDPATPDLLAEHRAAAAGLHLLPGFDEVVLGYADRSCTVPAEHAERIVPGGNGMFRATVVDGGQAVGTWRWARRGQVRTVDAEPFTAFSPALSTALAAAGPPLAARAGPAHPSPGGSGATAGAG